MADPLPLCSTAGLHRAYARFFRASTIRASPTFPAGASARALRLPVRNNYFLHQMLLGTYTNRVPDGVPLPRAHAAQVPRASGSHGGVTRYGVPRDPEESSIDALAISNICEWLDQAGIDQLFEQVVRVAKPGARFCFRNFVGHTEIPERFRNVIVEDAEAGRRAILGDRSCVQARIVICRIVK